MVTCICQPSVAIEIIKTAHNNTLFIVLQKPTDTCSNVHDKLCLPLQGVRYTVSLTPRHSEGWEVRYTVVYLHACIGFFPLQSHVTSREISRYITAAWDVLQYFPGSAVPLKLWLPMVQCQLLPSCECNNTYALCHTMLIQLNQYIKHRTSQFFLLTAVYVH